MYPSAQESSTSDYKRKAWAQDDSEDDTASHEGMFFDRLVYLRQPNEYYVLS
jgi:hypothetical protein